MHIRTVSALLKAAFIPVLLLSCEADRDVEPAADCLVQASSNNGLAIDGSYIVILQNSDASTTSGGRQVAAFAKVLSKYAIDTEASVLASTSTETTFLASLSSEESATLQQDPAVELVEPDRIMSICSCVDLTTPTTLPWNIQLTGYGRGDRQTGKTVWIIDTGIDLDHPDLSVDTQRSRSFLSSTTSADDANGHGTHVAGIIGALNNSIGVTGVASGATLVSLRVLDQLGEGRLSGVIQAVNFVAQNGTAGDVVNMSLGGEGTSSTLDRAIRTAADKGILFAIAAGNESQSVEDQSPARVNHANVFTVSAIDRTGKFASFSNFGASVDVAAYGVRINSTYKNGQYATLSGTSMAAPHVAGLLYIRGNNIPTNGTATSDPDGTPDPIARE